MEALNERRSILRKAIHSTVSVFDRNTNEYVGLLADYSSEGVMVTTSVNPIELGRTYQFMVLVQSSRGADSTDRGDFNATSMWSERTSPSFYGTGFRLENPGPEILKLLESCTN